VIHRFAAAQLNVIQHERADNLARALRLAQRAVSMEARFICLPECMTSDYTPDARRYAEPVPGPSCEPFADLARRAGVYILLGLFELDGQTVYNTVAVIGPTGLVGKYRKRKLWVDQQQLEGLDDPAMFTAGDLPGVMELGGLKAGILICWDGHDNQSWREIAAAGPDVIFYPNNRGTVEPHLLARRARELGVPIVAVNRVGRRRIYPPDPQRTLQAMPHAFIDGGRVYYTAVGDSAIIDRTGRILAHNAGEETVLVAELDLSRP
jgi:predicted amidohydrolase